MRTGGPIHHRTVAQLLRRHRGRSEQPRSACAVPGSRLAVSSVRQPQPIATAQPGRTKATANPDPPGATSAAHPLPLPPSLSSGRARSKPWGSAPRRPTYSESGSCADGAEPALSGAEGACPERSRRAPFVSRPQLRSARSSWDGLARFAQPSQPTHLPQLRSVSPRRRLAKMMDTIAMWN
jgi:hypothetical protein